MDIYLFLEKEHIIIYEATYIIPCRKITVELNAIRDISHGHTEMNDAKFCMLENLLMEGSIIILQIQSIFVLFWRKE